MKSTLQNTNYSENERERKREIRERQRDWVIRGQKGRKRQKATVSNCP